MKNPRLCRGVPVLSPGVLLPQEVEQGKGLSAPIPAGTGLRDPSTVRNPFSRYHVCTDKSAMDASCVSGNYGGSFCPGDGEAGVPTQKCPFLKLLLAVLGCQGFGIFPAECGTRSAGLLLPGEGVNFAQAVLPAQERFCFPAGVKTLFCFGIPPLKKRGFWGCLWGKH